MRVASRRVGLVDVLWHGFYQSPSRRPEQLQWPFECTSAMGEQQLRRKRPAGGHSPQVNLVVFRRRAASIAGILSQVGIAGLQP